MEKSKNNGDIASFIDVYFLGISSVISGLLTFWNVGFAFGFWEYFLTTAFISVGYFTLVLCLAEMISILPFSGGSYGFSRVTMGPYLGFLIGCFDSVSIIIFIAIVVRGGCTFLTYSIGPSAPSNLDPLLWFLLYLVCLLILIPLGRWHFHFISVVGAVAVALCVIFIFSTIPNQNFEQNVTRQDMSGFFADGGMKSFMQLLPISSWMYIGIDLVCLVCDDTPDAMHSVPKAIILSMITLIVLAFLLLVTCPANAPGLVVLSSVPFPLNAGYSAAFKISDRTATILSLPGIFINLYAVIYAYGRQICALARSHLLPTFLAWTTKNNVPYMALIFGSLLGYSILLGLYYNDPDYQMTLNYLFNAAQMGSFSVYIVSMLSFIIFRYKYSSLQRHFKNPLGIPSAIVGIVIFLFAFIGVAFFQEDQYRAVTYYTVFVAAMTVYYFGYAKRVECFSPEEQSILFAAYIIKTNTRKRTLWSRVGRKLLSLVDSVDSSHRMSEWFKRSNRHSSNHSHGSHGSPGHRSSVRGSVVTVGAGNANSGKVVVAESSSEAKVDETPQQKELKIESREIAESPTATTFTSAVGVVTAVDAATDLYEKLADKDLDETVDAKLKIKGNSSVGSSAKYRVAAVDSHEEQNLKVVPVEDSVHV